jgi:hypothetical protein
MHPFIHCNTLQHIFAPMSDYNTLQHIYNTLQHIHCKTLQHIFAPMSDKAISGTGLIHPIAPLSGGGAVLEPAHDPIELSLNKAIKFTR